MFPPGHRATGSGNRVPAHSAGQSACRWHDGTVIRIQISITEEQAKRLRLLALAGNVSQAHLMRQAVDALLARDELGQRLERARRPLGAYRSGDSAAAVQHDEALVDAFLP